MPTHDLTKDVTFPDTSLTGDAGPTGDAGAPEDLSHSKNGKLDSMKSTAAEAVDGVASIARSMPEQVDQVATTTGRVIGDAQRAIERGSDEALMAGTVLTTGLAMGMLIGRAPRLAVALVLVPAAAMGASLLQRRGFGLGSEFRTGIDRPSMH